MTSDATADTFAKLQSALDLTKATFGLRDPDEYRVKALELLEAMLSAQESALRVREAHSALIQRIRDLEAEVAELKAQKGEAERYQLKDYGGGTYAYALKPEEARGEPPHRLCAACFNKGQKSILQFAYNTGDGRQGFDCPECKQKFLFGVVRASSSRDSDPGDWRAF